MVRAFVQIFDKTLADDAKRTYFVVEDTPFRWDLMEGAKGVQLAELGYQAWAERRWVDVDELGV